MNSSSSFTSSPRSLASALARVHILEEEKQAIRNVLHRKEEEIEALHRDIQGLEAKLVLMEGSGMSGIHGSSLVHSRTVEEIRNQYEEKFASLRQQHIEELDSMRKSLREDREPRYSFRTNDSDGLGFDRDSDRKALEDSCRKRIESVKRDYAVQLERTQRLLDDESRRLARVREEYVRLDSESALRIQELTAEVQRLQCELDLKREKSIQSLSLREPIAESKISVRSPSRNAVELHEVVEKMLSLATTNLDLENELTSSNKRIADLLSQVEQLRIKNSSLQAEFSRCEKLVHSSNRRVIEVERALLDSQRREHIALSDADTSRLEVDRLRGVLRSQAFLQEKLGSLGLSSSMSTPYSSHSIREQLTSPYTLSNENRNGFKELESTPTHSSSNPLSIQSLSDAYLRGGRGPLSPKPSLVASVLSSGQNSKSDTLNRASQPFDSSLHIRDFTSSGLSIGSGNRGSKRVAFSS